RHIAQMHVDHRPRIAGRLHLGVVVVDLVEQGTTHDFQVFHIVAVPDNFHRIEVEELHLQLDLGEPAAGRSLHAVTHTRSTLGYGSAPAARAGRVPAGGLL